jgi:hypothetical protein
MRREASQRHGPAVDNAYVRTECFPRDAREKGG